MKTSVKKDKILITPFGFQPDYIREVANSFAELNFNIIILGGNQHNKNWYHNNVKVLNIRGDDSPNRSIIKKINDLLLYFYKLYKYILKNKITFIYDPSIGRPILIISNYIILKLLRRKIALTVHNVLPHSGYNRRNHLFFSIIYKYLADFLIAHTEYISKQLIKEFNIPTSKVIVAAHGTYKVAENSSITKKDARSKLNIEQNEFVILVFGQQYPYKGTDILLNEYLPIVEFKFCLLIIGSGDSNYIRYLKKIIQNSKQKDRISFNFNYVNDSEVELYFKCADVVCLPYTEGSQSGVLFLSYAYGRPVLAADVGNFKNDIMSGITGEIFDRKSPIEFKEKLYLIKKNISSYDENRIKEFAYNNFSWNKFAQIIQNNILDKI